jgi:outer membrane protein assembly factor BamB
VLSTARETTEQVSLTVFDEYLFMSRYLFHCSGCGWFLAVAGLFCPVLNGQVLTGRPLAQFTESGLISSVAANRSGLERAWFTQVELDSSHSKVSYVTLYVSSSVSKTIHEVSHDRGKELFSDRELDNFGEPLGVEGAKKLADEKVRELTALGFNPKLETRLMPEITLYVVTDHGLVQAIDGETGRTRWSAQIGKSDHPTLEPAANDDYLAVINGSVLYVANARDGTLVWQRQLRGVPGAGPGISLELVHVPMITGMMETYNLKDWRRPPSFFQSVGRAVIQPTVTPNSVAWPTDRGHVYVGRANVYGSRYRLVAHDTIVAPVSYLAPNHFFVASFDGYVYCVQESSGEVLWRFSTGNPISHPPVVIRDAVYVINDDGGMYCVAVANGQEQWWTPNVRYFLAASNDRVYTTDKIGRILIIDDSTGSRISTIAVPHLDLQLINFSTDRIYVGTTRGLIQCLHEPQLELPLVYAAPPKPVEKPKIEQKGLDETETKPAPKAPTASPFDSPFGGADPFGAAPSGGTSPKPAAPAGGGVDPFGGGADPFGGGADPFGTP